jgi:hypothetical protein
MNRQTLRVRIFPAEFGPAAQHLQHKPALRRRLMHHAAI